MFNLRVLILALVACIFSVPCASKDVLMKICYVPFGVETYVPMNVENIESHCSFTGEIDIQSKHFRDIESLISSASPGLFEDGIVRAKITFSNSAPVYIDNNGGIKKGIEYYRLSPSALAKLRKIFETVTFKKAANTKERE